jgi:hypothetical protein
MTKKNNVGTSTTLEDKSKPADLTGRLLLKFKDKVKVRGRPKRALKQLCSFNKTGFDRATKKNIAMSHPQKKKQKR